MDSWKDIAAYLKRDVSTVQRWEKREGMPVHRHVHDKLGTVYAFRSELDRWWHSRASSLPQSESGEGTPSAPPAVNAPRRMAVILALGGTLTVTAILASWQWFARAPSPAPGDIQSLAVLPLESPDRTQEYLSDGITQALISELGKIRGLRVIARSSVMKYRGNQTAPRDVARDLGVQALVAGSVERKGDRIRIAVRLVDPRSNRDIWSDAIERDAQNVLQLQREVASAIADRLRGEGRTSAGSAPAPRQVAPAAYDELMRARYLSVRTTDTDNQAAIALLESAIARDAGFAAAHAELAAALVTRLAYVAPHETGDLEQRAFAAAEKALSLDPDLPEAHIARGDLLWSHTHRFAHERAVAEFRRALERNPNSDLAHQRVARVFVHVGFFEEALHHAAMALAINPSNAQALNSRAQAMLWMGKDEEALSILLSIPGPVLPELVEANRAFALARLGRPRDAWTHVANAVRKSSPDPGGNLPAIQALLLADSEPHKIDRLLVEVADRKAVNPAHHAAYFAAAASARMGRAAEAVRWLREAAETGFPCYPLFASDPNLQRVRDDPQFQAFLGEMQRRFESLRRAMLSAGI